MRPILLEIEGFGPFAAKEVVDFAKLPVGAPFTISGPTGAGKTSLLDAMCYALFDESSGNDRDGAQLRSHFAAATTPTEVRFTFLLGTDLWRVTRSPKYQRPAQRGGGLTEQAAQVALERKQADRWSVQGRGAREVNERIEKLLGFSAGQFRQVVVLPQGQFRKLLTASSADREKILATLFGTELYQKLQEELKAVAKARLAQIANVQTRRETLLAHHNAADLEALQALVAAQGAALLNLREEQEAAEQARVAADTALKTGQDNLGKLRDAQRAAAELADWQATQPEQDARKVKLVAAERAAQVAPQVQKSSDLAADRQRLAQELVKATEHVAAAEAALQDANRGLEAATAEAAQMPALQQRRGVLADLQPKVQELHKAVAEAARAETARNAELAKASAAQQAVDAAIEQAKRSKERADHAGQLAASYDGRAARVQALQRVLQVQNGLQQAERVRTDAVAHEQTARSTLQSATDNEVAALRAFEAGFARWVAGQAARLAKQLQPDQPCPVCGSTAHPKPAEPGDAPVDDAALQRLRDAHEASRTATKRHEAALAERQRALDVAQERVQSLQSQLAGLDPALVAADQPAHLAARDALAEAETAQRQLAEHQTAAQEANAAVERAKIAAEQAVNVLETAKERATRAETHRDQLLADVPEALRPAGALAQELAALDSQLQVLTTQLEAARTAQYTANAALASAKERLATTTESHQRVCDAAQAAATAAAAALAQAGFADAVDWQQAMLDPPSRQALQAKHQAWHDELIRREQNQQTAAHTAEGLAEPDLPALKAGADEAAATYKAAAEAHGAAQTRLKDLQRTADELTRLARDSAAKEAEYVLVKNLADQCNDNKLTLQRFVLSGLLDDVLAACNLRLHKMSRGRFALQRVGGSLDGRRAGGLDLEVNDAHTGQARPAATLSGGEGFLASLALALGLSDVVQGYQGGIRLDALFVDEGFGTLDPDALELAMGALSELVRSEGGQGRLVGVISHVPELKQRLARGIEVVLDKQGRGSHVQVVAPPPPTTQAA